MNVYTLDSDFTHFNEKKELLENSESDEESDTESNADEELKQVNLSSIFFTKHLSYLLILKRQMLTTWDSLNSLRMILLNAIRNFIIFLTIL